MIVILGSSIVVYINPPLASPGTVTPEHKRPSSSPVHITPRPVPWHLFRRASSSRASPVVYRTQHLVYQPGTRTKSHASALLRRPTGSSFPAPLYLVLAQYSTVHPTASCLGQPPSYVYISHNANDDRGLSVGTLAPAPRLVCKNQVSPGQFLHGRYKYSTLASSSLADSGSDGTHPLTSLGFPGPSRALEGTLN